MSDYDLILTTLHTTDDATLLEEEIEILLQSLYSGEKGFDDSLNSNIRVRTANEIKNVIGNAADKKSFLEGLKDIISHMDVVKISLAFEPSQLGINRMYSIVVQSTGKLVLLDISYEPKLMGGAVISYKGQYRDFSLYRFFKQDFDNSKDEIIKILEKNKMSKLK